MDHRVTVFMLFSQRIHSNNDITKINMSGFDSRMQQVFNKRFLFALPDAVVWFVLEVRGEDFVGKMRC